jgi:hypothetical protein
MPLSDVSVEKELAATIGPLEPGETKKSNFYTMDAHRRGSMARKSCSCAAATRCLRRANLQIRRVKIWPLCRGEHRVRGDPDGPPREKPGRRRSPNDRGIAPASPGAKQLIHGSPPGAEVSGALRSPLPRVPAALPAPSPSSASRPQAEHAQLEERPRVGGGRLQLRAGRPGSYTRRHGATRTAAPPPPRGAGATALAAPRPPGPRASRPGWRRAWLQLHRHGYER